MIGGQGTMPIEGMGPCPVPTESGSLCGRTIKDGEPIGVFVMNATTGAQVGHRTCVQQHLERKEMAKRISQQGAGGAVDFNNAKDMVANATPFSEFKSGRVVAPADLENKPVAEVNPDEPGPSRRYVEEQNNIHRYEPAEVGRIQEAPLPGFTPRGGDFESDLTSLLNFHSEDARANSPDFILAEYLVDCLSAYRRASRRREEW